MRKSGILGIIMFLFILQAFGQKPEISNAVEMMILGERPCYRLKITESEEKSVEKLWETYVRETFGSKLKSQKGAKEMLAEECKLKSVSDKPFNLYASTGQAGKETVVVVWIDLGSAFLTPEYDRKASESVVSLLNEFSYVVKRYYADEQIKMDENSLKQAERVLEKLVSQNEDLIQDIKNYEEKIETAKKELEKNAGEQESAKSLIEKSREKLTGSQSLKEKIGK
jgi:hypothetical protein